ncbi:cold-regulated 413 inner membrane protein 1, chloroplastic-like [Gastrolobium bilobum]|uniref:cold-regulated 413 inner membrane protein 1, chloroplastic-like n=1 Tax=Gastrolobium bilobum TaxID=150636 RepID=UPI002AAF9308|nr:cold-regulated 413 inner membrane protein 1, chloroplastic-like [Gastrolobium bilobum]
MSSIFLSSTAIATATATATERTNFSLFNSLRSPSLSFSRSSSSSLSYTFNPLSIPKSKTNIRTTGRIRVRCYAASLSAHNLQWISAVSSLVLILAKGTAVPKSFIVPLFALQAPLGVVTWIKGRYGMWSAFLALLVRLFFYIPGELELPFLALLLVIVAPYEAMRLRNTKEGAVISLLIAVYLAFQHFSRTSLQKSFDQGSIVATLAVICITVASLLLLI